MLVETRSESSTRHGHRTVVCYPRGIRTVTVEYGYGECWRRYIIVPKRVWEIEGIKGKRAFPCWDPELEPEAVVPWKLFSLEHYGGPGRGFADRLFVFRNNDRFIVFAQRGGLDV